MTWLVKLEEKQTRNNIKERRKDAGAYIPEWAPVLTNKS